MKFNSAKEMLDFINGENGALGHDLYSQKGETYVFRYNEAGSIATYRVTKEEVEELDKKSKEAGGEYWSAFLGPGGCIWDDPSHECYEDGRVSNLQECDVLIGFDDWVVTHCYGDLADTEV